MKSDLPGIPADHEFLAFLKGCEPPTQFYDILTRRTFDYSLFFDPKPEGLGRWAFNGRNMEVDVAGPHPILLQDAMDLTERHYFLSTLAIAEHHDRPTHQCSNCHDDPGKTFHTDPNLQTVRGRSDRDTRALPSRIKRRLRFKNLVAYRGSPHPEQGRSDLLRCYRFLESLHVYEA